MIKVLKTVKGFLNIICEMGSGGGGRGKGAMSLRVVSTRSTAIGENDHLARSAGSTAAPSVVSRP
jgi:hypothetical protein